MPASPEQRPRRAFRHAMAWAFVMNWGQKGLASIIVVILAALVGPRAFGTLAMALVYIAFIDIFLEQGLTAAIVQRSSLERRHLDSTFWLTVALSFVLTAASIALSSWWASANRLPELAAVINALSLTIPIRGFTVVQQAVLQRELDFKSLAVRSNISVLIGGALGLAAAIMGWGVWALVTQQLAAAVAALALLWRLSHWKPSFSFSRSHAMDMLGFSSGVLVAKLGTHLDRQSDALIMGLFFGPLPLGLYRLADRLFNTIINLSTRPIQIVALSEFSRSREVREQLHKRLLQSARFSAALAVPGLAILAASGDLVMAALGPRWTPATNALRILCAVGVVQALTLFTTPLLQALGRPHLLAGMTWLLGGAKALAILVVSLWFIAADEVEQVNAVAGTRAVAFLFLYAPVHLIIAGRLIGSSSFRMLAACMPALVSGGIAATTIIVVRLTGATSGLHPILALVIVALPAGVLACSTLLLLDQQLWMHVSRLVGQMLKRRTQRGVSPPDSTTQIRSE